MRRMTTTMNKQNRYEATFLNENAIGSFNERINKLVSEFIGVVIDDAGKATMSIYGPLLPIDYDFITTNLESLKNDDEVKSIVLHINSPGGAVAGLFDCCDYIKSIGKPIKAYISGMACSAAYAIASSCDKVYSQQDAETGCCGCYAHVLETADSTYEKMGFLSRVFRSKNAPRKNVSCITNEEEAKAFQAEVDAHGEKYLAYVAANRGVDIETAEQTFGQGASVTAEYALANNMIDGICSIEEMETTSSSLHEEGEGEDTDMDITAMSAEEQATLFAQLCEANPSLLNERVEAAKKVEGERLAGLEALRNGTDAVNVIVDAAVTEGKNASDIAIDVIKAMQENPVQTHEETRTAKLDSLVEDTVVIAAPVAKSEDQLIDEMVSRM